uniref:SRR1-like domain-containing protein n=1 Tax=Panagrolaimus superbus TaxID=310955 RepID=A0A914Y1Q9_9BILA
MNLSGLSVVLNKIQNMCNDTESEVVFNKDSVSLNDNISNLMKEDDHESDGENICNGKTQCLSCMYASEGDTDETVRKYIRDPISTDDVISSMKFVAEHNPQSVANYIYLTILPFLKNKKVIQIQLYGIGFLDESEGFRGPFQLAIAFCLRDFFKQSFRELRMLSQEPHHFEEEKLYLRANGVEIVETTEFSSKHFIEASTLANIRQPAFICYMIHGLFSMYEEFLQAHWTPQLLSRIIFVVTNPLLKCFYHDQEFTSKVAQFIEFGKIEKLEFNKESPAFECLGYATVCSISEEMAHALVAKFP